MGIVPNRSGSPQGVLQALWRNLFRSNPFHFGSADEADGWLTPARPSSTWSPLPAASPRISARCPGPLRGSTFQGGGKTRPSGWSVFALPSIEEEAVRVGSDPSDRSVAANVLLRQEPDEEEEEEDDGEEGGDDYDKDNDGYSIRKLPIPNPLSGIQEVQSLQGFHFRSGLSSRDQAVATHPRDGGRRVVPTPELRPHLYPARHLFC